MPAQIEIVKDTPGQRIYFYPQEGRPDSTPEVEIKDKYGSTLSDSSTDYVTLDSVNTTIAAAASKNDMELALTSVAGIEVSKTYLAINSLQQREWLRVYAINSSTNVITVDEKLEYDYEIGDAFQSTFFYRVLQDHEIATLERLQRARAVYTVDSQDYTHETNYSVVLTPLINPLTAEFVKKRRPSIMPRESSQTRGSDYLDLRETAFDIVKKAIRKKGSGQKNSKNYAPALLRTPEDIEEWALAELDILLQRDGLQMLPGWDPQAALEHLEERAMRLRNSSLDSLQWMDLSQSDSPSESEVTPKLPNFMR